MKTTVLSRAAWWQAAVIAVAALISLGCWALSSPPGSSPDDIFHQASIWCGHGLDQNRCRDSGDPNTRIVPHQVGTAPCYVTQPTIGAQCLPRDYGSRLRPDFEVGSGNWTRLYPPAYYGAMSYLTSDSLDRSIVTIRMVNSLILVALVAALAWLVPRRLRWVAPLGFLFMSVPLGMFIVSSINPSAWTTIGAGTLWLAVYAAFEVRGWRQPALLGLGLVAAVLEAGARGDGGPWAVIGIALALGLRWRDVRSTWRVTLASIALMVVPALFYFSSGQAGVATNGIPGYPRAEATDTALLLSNLFNLPLFWTAPLGIGPAFLTNLGWFDTPMPMAVGVASVGAAAFALLQGWQAMWWSKRLVLLAIFGTLIGYPLILLQESHLVIGYGVQPRYLLPALMMLGGVSLLPRRHWIRTINRTQAFALVFALSAANSLALYVNIWRYTDGMQSPMHWIGDYDWWWWGAVPLSPVAVWLIGTGAFATVAGLLVGQMVRPGRGRLTSGQQRLDPGEETLEVDHRPGHLAGVLHRAQRAQSDHREVLHSDPVAEVL